MPSADGGSRYGRVLYRAVAIETSRSASATVVFPALFPDDNRQVVQRDFVAIESAEVPKGQRGDHGPTSYRKIRLSLTSSPLHALVWTCSPDSAPPRR
jgi:hypothetical protein